MATLRLNRQQKSELAQRRRQEAAELELRLVRAAFVETAAVPPDVPPPSDFGAYTEGWKVFFHAREVRQCWSGETIHGEGTLLTARTPGRIARQQATWLHSSRARALAALRNEIEMATARELRDLDLAIAEALDREGSRAA